MLVWQTSQRVLVWRCMKIQLLRLWLNTQDDKNGFDTLIDNYFCSISKREKMSCTACCYLIIQFWKRLNLKIQPFFLLSLCHYLSLKHDPNLLTFLQRDFINFFFVCKICCKVSGKDASPGSELVRPAQF